MITAIAVDDEPKALELIQLHSNKISSLELKACFRDALDAIRWIQQNKVDLIFLDINMPNLSGLKFRSIIGEQPLIIFTTAYSEYAVESYAQDALDYLLKPIAFDRFLKAVIKAETRLKSRQPINLKDSSSEDQSLYIKSGTKLHRLNLQDILYLEKDGNYIQFFTSEKRVLSRLNMSQALEILPPSLFLRVHKSYIIAIRHIDVVEQGQVLIAGKRIPVAKTYRDDLMNTLNENIYS